MSRTSRRRTRRVTTSRLQGFDTSSPHVLGGAVTQADAGRARSAVRARAAQPGRPEFCAGVLCVLRALRGRGYTGNPAPPSLWRSDRRLLVLLWMVVRRAALPAITALSVTQARRSSQDVEAAARPEQRRSARPVEARTRALTVDIGRVSTGRIRRLAPHSFRMHRRGRSRPQRAFDQHTVEDRAAAVA